jgi:hypothetical protein
VAELDASFDGGAGQALSGRAGEQRVAGLPLAFGEPGLQDADGGGQQGRVAFLAALMPTLA